jgi:diguanylate cyclase (GGDEF)-like protein/PAS domain S-box-containing protein
MSRTILLLIVLAWSWLSSPAWATAEESTVRIGVLSFRPLEQTLKQWQPTADYLSAHVPGYRFTVIPMYYKELDLAVNRHEFDFVLTNPEHYINVRFDHSLTVLATLMPLAEGHPVTTFGGVILTRAERTDIATLEDIKGKVVASPAEQSLGGYLMQRWQLYKQGIEVKDLAGIRFTGMPHDKVVMAVLAGEADVGFVRTGILESLARDGKIRLDQFKVLNLQPKAAFPQLLSTELYPEWPFAAMPEASDTLVKQVTLALLNIQPQEHAAVQGKYFGFSPAGNYSQVEAMMARLKVNPERAHEFDIRDVSRKYAVPLLSGALVLLLAASGVAIHLARTRKRLRISLLDREELSLALQQANVTLEEKVAQRTRELQTSEARFRHMFEHHASPMMLVDPYSGDIVDANHAAEKFYGYAAVEMRAMHITQINIDSPQHDAEERELARRNERNYFMCTHRLSNGEMRSVEVYASPVEVGGKELLFSIVHDITARKQLEEQMHELAFYDALTKLPNRRLLVDRLGKLQVTSKRSQRYAVLMFLDLDNFKQINDLHGHDMGDLLLVEVSKRLLACIREEDSVARLGGDEFVVMLENLSEHLDAAVLQSETVAEKIRAALSEPYRLHRLGVNGTVDLIEHHCSSSIGVTVFRGQEHALEELLRWTDMAMYQAKEAGRNVIRFFDPKMQASIEQRAAMENDLRLALEQRQFSLYYQVQVDHSGRAVGAEALLRWLHPQRGMVSPLQFIPLAEENGMIIRIGLWVLDTACSQLAVWQGDVTTSHLRLAVNVSAKQFHQPDFVAQVHEVLVRTGADPTKLELELTESMVLENVEETIRKMGELKTLGVRFSMDDFGTGYSSLIYLKRLPLDQIKIDQSFVRDITTDHDDAAIVQTIIAMAHNLDLEVIAEGVETEAQRAFLEQRGCRAYQGYLFGRPVPIAGFTVQPGGAA